jgi:hypothetical protein
VLTALNYLNPFAYINGVAGSGHAHGSAVHPIALGQGGRIALEWIIAAVALTVAVRLWSTREV